MNYIQNHGLAQKYSFISLRCLIICQAFNQDRTTIIFGFSSSLLYNYDNDRAYHHFLARENVDLQQINAQNNLWTGVANRFALTRAILVYMSLVMKHWGK